jgi:diphthamide synthase (EF-2-diphthine--ammonia ligase)
MASSVAEELLLINVSRCLRAKLACVDAKQLTESFAGREFDDALHVDPRGERGEFHTCVYAGPMFTAPPLHFISHLAPVARIVCQPSQVCVTHSRASILNSGTIHLIKKTRSRVLLLRSDKNDCRSQNASMRRQ